MMEQTGVDGVTVARGCIGYPWIFQEVRALLAGRPVVSYDIDGAREVVRDDVTGYLVRPRAVDELADALLRMLRDPAKARAMAPVLRMPH